MKLSSCPFCGSEDVHVRLYNQPSVVCQQCLCMGPAAERLERLANNVEKASLEAMELWNQRVTQNVST